MSLFLALAIGFPERSTLAGLDIAHVEHWIGAVVEHLRGPRVAATALR